MRRRRFINAGMTYLSVKALRHSGSTDPTFEGSERLTITKD